MTLKELKYLDRLMEGMEAEQVAAIAGSLHLELALAALNDGWLQNDEEVARCIEAQRTSQPKASIALLGENVPFKI
jgi:hypothetical protein